MPDHAITSDTVVELSDGWKLTFDERNDESLQGFVKGPGEGQSASLNFALSTGCVSDDEETPIPDHILSELQDYDEFA